MLDSKKVRTNVYLNKQAKQAAQEVLDRYGVNLSEAINLFLSIIAEKKTLPFEFHIPNQTTQKAIQDVLNGQNIEEVTIEDILCEDKET
ncbi:type II toxin-antitoxin system RelB/DinJ family antitoxin [Dissulfuribacter thermophilus]|uniref:type II toxin-antitoxin system RelB/DinJ family antitoxin n=1 Tax=Dissulfuribacter thermophilus TaxID=1156395 RepID=UPI000835F74F|nr:type II toxin-antitoxin system RelB/DinJ family antitoxin [Dissulfuribacter thermophilus]